jgi:hypothetical protein
MIEIGPLRPGDRAAWEVLARGYNTNAQARARYDSVARFTGLIRYGYPL